MEGFLAERVDELITHGIDRDQIAGQPPGALLILADRYTNSAASVLHDDLVTHTSGRTADIERALRRLVGPEASKNGPEELLDVLDRWINRRLIEFKRETGKGGSIWHISSGLGTFQALVNAETFDAKRMAELRSGAVVPLLERLMRREMLEAINDSTSGGHGAARERPSSVRAQINDVERFLAATHEIDESTDGGVFTRQQLFDADLLSPRHWIDK